MDETGLIQLCIILVSCHHTSMLDIDSNQHIPREWSFIVSISRPNIVTSTSLFIEILETGRAERVGDRSANSPQIDIHRDLFNLNCRCPGSISSTDPLGYVPTWRHVNESCNDQENR
jgi:hypothetical protein